MEVDSKAEELDRDIRELGHEIFSIGKKIVLIGERIVSLIGLAGTEETIKELKAERAELKAEREKLEAQQAGLKTGFTSSGALCFNPNLKLTFVFRECRCA